jgi:hypothetical protein
VGPPWMEPCGLPEVLARSGSTAVGHCGAPRCAGSSGGARRRRVGRRANGGSSACQVRPFSSCPLATAARQYLEGGSTSDLQRRAPEEACRSPPPREPWTSGRRSTARPVPGTGRSATGSAAEARQYGMVCDVKGRCRGRHREGDPTHAQCVPSPFASGLAVRQGACRPPSRGPSFSQGKIEKGIRTTFARPAGAPATGAWGFVEMVLAGGTRAGTPGRGRPVGGLIAASIGRQVHCESRPRPRRATAPALPSLM